MKTNQFKHFTQSIILFLNFIFIFYKAYGADLKTPFSWPSSNHAKEVFYDSVSSPLFLIPMGTAAILQIGKWDEKISLKLRTERPIFKNRVRTDRASDAYRSASTVVMLASSLVISCDHSCWDQKAFLLATDYLANIFITYSRNAFAYPINRTRPDGGERSFPSGHATSAAARVSLANINFQNSDWPSYIQTPLEILNWSLAYIVAYARVEDSAHYPSDVLFGLGFGYFMATIIKENFYSPQIWAKDKKEIPLISPQVSYNSLGIKLNYIF